MAAIDVMRRYLQAVQRGDWETGFGYEVDDQFADPPAGLAGQVSSSQ